jgi:hypothetical protein
VNEADFFTGLIVLAGLIFLGFVGLWFSTFFRRDKSKASIPSPEAFDLPYAVCFGKILKLLQEERFSGCRWRLTYDNLGEGRIQARVYALPSGSESGEKIDVLLNILFHALEEKKTELEWSYVVMGGRFRDTEAFMEQCSSKFRDLLRA